MKKIAIIGGGAAGMMAAATASELYGRAAEIFLLEKNNELGKKVKISGGGRCNVTTGIEDLRQVLKAYPRGAKFFRTALYNFSPEKIRQWFEDHGVPMKVEADMRAFPVSDNGDDVVGVFEKIFREKNVHLRFDSGVTEIKRSGKQFVIGDLIVDEVILTTGGQAYRHTGSTGDGYSLAESLGHSITQLGPSLNSFMLADQWAKNLSGVSFSDVNLKLAGQEFRGAMLFTHKGITGPAVFALSSLCAFEKIGGGQEPEMRIDFCPEESYDSLREKILQELGDKQLHKVLSPFATKSFVAEYAAAHDLDFSCDKSNLPKKTLNKAIEMLKNCEVRVTGRLPGDEFVTAGGIELSEVDSKSMQSRICPGLFFAGEILNIDGFTGGYNLQVAWATGRLAGETCLESGHGRED